VLHDVASVARVNGPCDVGFRRLTPPPPRLQDNLEYKKKQRPLKIRMLDGTVKTVMVDDSKIVSDMLMTICARIGQELRPRGRRLPPIDGDVK